MGAFFFKLGAKKLFWERENQLFLGIIWTPVCRGVGRSTLNIYNIDSRSRGVGRSTVNIYNLDFRSRGVGRSTLNIYNIDFRSRGVGRSTLNIYHM